MPFSFRSVSFFADFNQIYVSNFSGCFRTCGNFFSGFRQCRKIRENFLKKNQVYISSGTQTDHLRNITNCYHWTRGMAGPNFNFIPCLELDVYAQRTNLCFYKTLKKITNFSYSQIGIGPIYRNILCVSVCIYSNDALLLHVQLNQVLLFRRR